MNLLYAGIEGLDRYYTPPPVGLTPIDLTLSNPIKGYT